MTAGSADPHYNWFNDPDHGSWTAFNPRGRTRRPRRLTDSGIKSRQPQRKRTNR